VERQPKRAPAPGQSRLLIPKWLPKPNAGSQLTPASRSPDNLMIDVCRPPLFKSEQNAEGITTMQKQIAIFAGLLLVLCLPFGIARADTIDQSFTPGVSASAAINDCCAFIGQTYTAGLTGTLTGVSVDVVESGGFNFPLNVQIRSVVGALPTTTILGQTSTTAFSFNDVITFAQSIDQVAGTRYAIVVNFVGAPPAPGVGTGTWSGALGNLYPGGDEVFSFDGGVTWSLSSPADTDDNAFITFVNTRPVPEPASITLLGLGLSLGTGLLGIVSAPSFSQQHGRGIH
jgi:hypothetical protein